jgi:hypothetical protein
MKRPMKEFILSAMEVASFMRFSRNSMNYKANNFIGTARECIVSVL